jgi:hypothetical protein
MDQDDFPYYVSSVLKEFEINNEIQWSHNDDIRLSDFDIIVKLPDDQLIFRTSGESYGRYDVNNFDCWIDVKNEIIFEYDFNAFYNSSKGDKNEIAAKIKEISREKIIFALKKLNLINEKKRKEMDNLELT